MTSKQKKKLDNIRHYFERKHFYDNFSYDVEEEYTEEYTEYIEVVYTYVDISLGINGYYSVRKRIRKFEDGMLDFDTVSNPL